VGGGPGSGGSLPSPQTPLPILSGFGQSWGLRPNFGQIFKPTLKGLGEG
jgi:hypothetical protein